jgi:hypothetical protein
MIEGGDASDLNEVKDEYEQENRFLEETQCTSQGGQL